MLQDISTQTFAIAQREAAYYCNLYSLLINGAAAYITANLFPCESIAIFQILRYMLRVVKWSPQPMIGSHP